MERSRYLYIYRDFQQELGVIITKIQPIRKTQYQKHNRFASGKCAYAKSSGGQHLAVWDFARERRFIRVRTIPSDHVTALHPNTQRSIKPSAHHNISYRRIRIGSGSDRDQIGWESDQIISYLVISGVRLRADLPYTDLRAVRQSGWFGAMYPKPIISGQTRYNQSDCRYGTQYYTQLCAHFVIALFG